MSFNWLIMNIQRVSLNSTPKLCSWFICRTNLEYPWDKF